MNQNWDNIKPGTKIGDRYKLLKKLYMGCGGAVYSCIDVETKKVVHLRFFSQEDVGDEEEFNQRIELIEKCTKICGEAIPQPVDHGFFEGVHYLIYKFANLRTLHDIFNSKRRLTEKNVREICERFFLLFSKIHASGMVHLGINPLTIFQMAGGLVSIKIGIMDFGMSPPVGAAHFLRPGREEGKYAYIAGFASPEQLEGQSKIDAKSDIYSLGMLIYMLVFKKPPFDGRSVDEVKQKAISHLPDQLQHGAHPPAGMVEFLKVATAKNPTERFRDIQEMMDSFSGSFKPEKTTVAVSGDAQPRRVPEPAIFKKQEGKLKEPSEERPTPAPPTGEEVAPQSKHQEADPKRKRVKTKPPVAIKPQELIKPPSVKPKPAPVVDAPLQRQETTTEEQTEAEEEKKPEEETAEEPAPAQPEEIKVEAVEKIEEKIKPQQTVREQQPIQMPEIEKEVTLQTPARQEAAKELITEQALPEVPVEDISFSRKEETLKVKRKSSIGIGAIASLTVILSLVISGLLYVSIFSKKSKKTGAKPFKIEAPAKLPVESVSSTPTKTQKKKPPATRIKLEQETTQRVTQPIAIETKQPEQIKETKKREKWEIEKQPSEVKKKSAKAKQRKKKTGKKKKKRKKARAKTRGLEFVD